MGLATFTRITTHAWLYTVPRIILRRLDTLLFLAPILLTSGRLRTGVFSLRGELFIELFRHIYLLPNIEEVRQYVAFVTSLMPAHSYVARRNVHVAAVDDECSTPFSGVLFCEASLLHQARSGTCLRGAHDLPHTTVLLYIHGGGFCTGNAHMSAAMFERMVAAFSARSQDPHRRLAVFSLEYGLAPEHPFPYALQQAVHAYLWLQQQGYHSIVIGGCAPTHSMYAHPSTVHVHRWRLRRRQPRPCNAAAAARRICRRCAHAGGRAAAVAVGGPHLKAPC